MSVEDVTINIPFTVKALEGETQEQVAAAMLLGLRAMVCWLNRAGRPHARILDGEGNAPSFGTIPEGEAARIAAVDGLTQEQLVSIVIAELKSHLAECVNAEGAYRRQKAAEAASEAVRGEVETRFG